MDLGDIVIRDGERYYVCGLDPVGVHPRYVYLEDVRTGKTVSVAVEQHFAATSRSQRRLRLVLGCGDESPAHADPAGEAPEPDGNS
jgi:hypothetical protein